MIPAVDPRQNRLFDPFVGVIPPAGRKRIGMGWQGVLRHVLLEVMPGAAIGRHVSDSRGAPTQALSSMAGLVFRADCFGGTAQEAAEASIFRSDVQYALNLEPGAAVSARTVERSQKRFRDHDRATRVVEDVTDRLVRALDRDVSRQRLDATHVFSHRASFGRTKLLAVTIKRFLTQLKRHDPDADADAALPEDLRQRSLPAQARLGADATDSEARTRCRQQAAADLHFVITRFANRADLTNRSPSNTTPLSLQPYLTQLQEIQRLARIDLGYWNKRL